MQVVVSWGGAAFRERVVARVHLGDRQGGRLLCASRCLCDSTHSRPQETAAGRNLITVFSTVNNPGENFSGKGAVGTGTTAAPGAVDDAPQTATTTRTVPAAKQSCCKKRHVLCGLFATRARRALDARDLRRVACTPPPTPRTPRPGIENRLSAITPDGALQQPDYADLRKKKPATLGQPVSVRGGVTASAAPTRGVSDRLPRAVRRTHPGRASRSPGPVHRPRPRTANRRRRRPR